VTRQQINTYQNQKNVNITNQETENIKAAGLATIMRINANATAQATQIFNKGYAQIAA